MQILWANTWQQRADWLKKAWLVAAGGMAVYLGGVQGFRNAPLGAPSQATGQPSLSRSREAFPDRVFAPAKEAARGVVGGIPGGSQRVARLEQGGVINHLTTSEPKMKGEDQKLVSTESMDLWVQHPAESAEKLRQLVEGMGGFLLTSETRGAQDAQSASLTVRVPAARFEDARTAIRKLGLRVESEKLESQDVTKQYVDQQARLRNLRAQETQYLSILKQAKTVKDTLAVSDELNEVRSQIEQQQAEFDALSKQVETVALTISLRAQDEARVFGFDWRPLYQLKLALRAGLEAVADYAAAMIGFLFYLPAILLWLATILVSAAIGWRILRWAGRTFLLAKPAATPVPGAD
jgi:molecular chaperone GrpE (heat shock protein)